MAPRRGVDVESPDDSVDVCPQLLDALPGTPMRVADVAPALAKYWLEAMRSGNSSRASQMNVVLVFGIAISPEAAREQLEKRL